MATNETERDAKLWSKLMGQLTPAARAAIAQPESPMQPLLPETETADRDHYDRWLAQLTPQTVAALEAIVPDAADDQHAPEMVRFILVEAADGEWAVTRQFKSAEAMARYMGNQEGKDMVLIPLFGVQLKFTAGPQRWLLLPDGQTALSIPRFPGEPLRQVEADLVFDTREEQLDGFVGAESLTIGKREREQPTLQTAGDDDEFEDDDEDE